MKLDSMEKMALSLPFYICSLFLSLLLYSPATLDPIPLATAPIARASATLESPRVSSEPPETARGSEEEAFFDVEAGLSVGAPLGALGGLRAGLAWSNLNMRAAVPDILHILAAGQCSVLFFHEAAAGMLAAIREAVPTLREVVCIGGADASAPSLAQWLGSTSDALLDFRVAEDAQGFQGQGWV